MAVLASTNLRNNPRDPFHARLIRNQTDPQNNLRANHLDLQALLGKEIHDTFCDSIGRCCCQIIHRGDIID